MHSNGKRGEVAPKRFVWNVGHRRNHIGDKAGCAAVVVILFTSTCSPADSQASLTITCGKRRSRNRALRCRCRPNDELQLLKLLWASVGFGFSCSQFWLSRQSLHRSELEQLIRYMREDGGLMIHSKSAGPEPGRSLKDSSCVHGSQRACFPSKGKTPCLRERTLDVTSHAELHGDVRAVKERHTSSK